MVREELVFQMSNGGKIKMSKTVLDIFNQMIQSDKASAEAGGVLLGRFIKSSKNIIVDKITVPMEGDIQTRYSFKRLSTFHQKIIDAEWAQSKGTCNYLGEWHTHPESDPTPSNVDLRDWKRKLKDDIFSSRYLYFIIVGYTHIKYGKATEGTFDIVRLKSAL